MTFLHTAGDPTCLSCLATTNRDPDLMRAVTLIYAACYCPLYPLASRAEISSSGLVWSHDLQGAALLNMDMSIYRICTLYPTAATAAAITTVDIAFYCSIIATIPDYRTIHRALATSGNHKS